MRDGLSRTERRFLTLAAEGRAEWPAVLPLMIEGEHAFYVTDTALIDIKERLTHSSPSLLVDTADGPSITPDGRALLEGRADRIALCGIDRWYGGVHLQGHDVPWRWDDQRGRIVAQ